MNQYTIFGQGVPPYALAGYNDGTLVTVGTYFYPYGDMTSGICLGGRVYVPDEEGLNNQSITISAWKVTNSPVNLASTPLQSKTTTIQATGAGWCEVLWDEPIPLDYGEVIFIGYTGAAGNQRYLYGPMAEPAFIRSVDDIDIALAEANVDVINAPRSAWRYADGQSGTGTGWYGTDIIFSPDSTIPDPIAEYSFNETSGTIAYDSSGNGRDLTLSSEDNFGMSRSGNGLHQVGGGETHLITNAAPWLNTAQRTVMFWGRRGSEGANDWSPALYLRENGAPENIPLSIHFNNDANQALFRIYAAGKLTSITAPEVPFGTWAHYALTFNNYTVRAYIDGELVGEAQADNGEYASIYASDGNLYLYGGDYQQLVMDDLRFFNVALSQAHVQHYMNESLIDDIDPPSEPLNVLGNATYQNVSLSWDASTDNVAVQNYVVYRSATQGFTPAPGDQVGGPAAPSYTETAPVGTWYYRVAARDEAGNESSPSAEITIVTSEAPVVLQYAFPSDLGWDIEAGTTYVDNQASGQTLGIVFALDAATAISGGRFYSPQAQSGLSVTLYENEVEVATKTGLSVVQGWNELLFDTYYNGLPGTDYLIAVYLPGPTQAYKMLTDAWPGTRVAVGPMYTTLGNNSFYRIGSGLPTASTSSWYGVDVIAPMGDGSFDTSFGATITEENAKTGALGADWSITGAGDTSNLGFARQFSVQPGETVDFSCDGAGTHIDIYRIGWYGGSGWRKVAEIENAATAQPDPVTVPDSNGGISCTNWSTTASWQVPSDALSGLFVAVYRNAAKDNASYIPFVVHDDARVSDLVYKTSDSTWALAYNYYGSPSSPLTGKSLYGSGGPLGAIGTRAHVGSYHRPIVTREGIPQTYWLACEAPLIRYLERNGFDVKYVASRDLDINAAVLSNASVFISSGHDEYWSEGMRSAVEAFRDNGGHALFMSGNEVFWRTRFNEDRTEMWCYKDTMDGPGPHVGGTPLDLVSWTGTWKDTRFPGRKPENTLTGTDFRMNGVSDHTAYFHHEHGYASHVAWRNTVLQAEQALVLDGVIGFEADRTFPTQPEGSYTVLASHTLNIDGSYADDNGQEYAGNGDLEWGIVSQRYTSGSVVIGFGTCQWSWALDTVHDRGGNYVNSNAQQFMVNVLTDLGASPATLMSGLTAVSAVSLDNYGVVPAEDRSGKVKVWSGSQWSAHPLKTWDGSQWVTRRASGSADGDAFTLSKG